MAGYMRVTLIPLTLWGRRMSMHKIPLTEMELEGLTKHGLDTGTPSQLSDVFRLGMAFALEKVKDIQLGFRIVNSGGMWEVYKIEGESRVSKLNAASSTIESIGISLDASKLPSFTIIRGAYKNLGCRGRYGV